MDGDGDLDAFFANGFTPTPNRIYTNNGVGVFTDSGQALGNADSNEMILGDLDGDGDLAALFATFSGPNKVWFNDFGACPVLCGDCDHDGDVEIIDALKAAQIAAGILSPTPSDFLTCDVDGDGDIDILDALLTAQFSAGLAGDAGLSVFT